MQFSNQALEGFLRRSINVRSEGKGVIIDHPCWELTLPRDWVQATPGVMEFLKREVPVSALHRTHGQVQGLAELLNAQGCLSFERDIEAYSLSDVKDLFTAVRNEWYGVYYRHRLWNNLREGTLSRNGFVAWLIYNYFLSRSAGNSSARFASFASNVKLGTAFYRETLEEYSHFVDYYYIRHTDLHLPDAEVDTYIQLPSSLAFCQQMLRMAEADWLAYLLISFFQESTVQFSEDCRTFYDQVEKAYSLPGLFEPWWKHIELDIEFCHARNLEEFFSPDEIVPVSQVTQSLTSAWFAFRMLLRSLDEICAEANKDDAVRLRVPIRSGLLDASANALVPSGIAPIHLPVGGTALDLHRALVDGNICAVQPRTKSADRDDLTFLRIDTVRSIYRAMSFAEETVEITTLGRLAESAFQALSSAERGSLREAINPATAEAMALANFLREMTLHPKEFCFALLVMAESYVEFLPFNSKNVRDLASNFLTMQLDDILSNRLITQRLQLDEFIRGWQSSSKVVDPADFFLGEPRNGFGSMLTPSLGLPIAQLSGAALIEL